MISGCAVLSNPPPDATDFDVVIDSRVEFSRNVAGHRFADRMDPHERRLVTGIVMDAARAARLDTVPMAKLDPADKRDAADRGLFAVGFTVDPENRFAFSAVEPVWLVANERDHATIRAELSGWSLPDCHSLAASCEATVGSSVDWAFDRDFGFIACDVSRCGSGMVASCRLHLPALCMSGLAERALKQAMEAGFSVSGGYSLEAQAAGAIFGISLPPAPSADERAGIARLSQAVRILAQYERRAREDLLERDPAQLLDHVGRSFGRARWSFTLGYDEAGEIVSGLRLGIAAGLLRGMSMGDATALWAILKRPERIARKPPAEPERESEARARVLRSRAKSLSLSEEYTDV